MIGSNINPKGYRVIKTERDIDRINNHAKNGFLPVCVRIYASKWCSPKFLLAQDNQTKEFVVFKSNELIPEFIDLVSQYSVIINWQSFYPIKFTIPFAAYLAPLDLEIGECVFLEDLISDHFATDPLTNNMQRLQGGEAKWNGMEFLVSV